MRKFISVLAGMALAVFAGAQPSPVQLQPASVADVNAGTSTTKYVTPAALAGWTGGGGSTVSAYSLLGNNTALSAPGASNQNLILGTPGFTETGSAASSQITVTGTLQGNTFFEFEIQGQNSGNTASTDFVATADNGNATTNYVDFGINSSTNSTGAYPTGADVAFMESVSADLYAGTVGNNTLRLFGNSQDQLDVSGTGTSIGGNAYTWGVLPPGATTSGPALNIPPTTYTVTGTSTATAFQGSYIGPATITDSSAGVVTDLFNLNIVGPAAGAGSLTVTRAHTLGILDSTNSTNTTTGAFVVASTYGTANTSASIGAGNANFGNSISANRMVTAAAAANTFGALPSGVSTSGSAFNVPASTSVTVTGTNTATYFQGNYFGVPSFTDASVGTVTDLFNTNLIGPAVGAGSLVVTRAHTLGILDATSAASSITGGLVVAGTYGTTATSVGIGGGNINAGGTLTVGGATTLTGNLTQTGKTTTYNGVATAGYGAAIVVAAPRQTAVTNALATLATYTVPAADSTYRISANVQVTAATTAAMTVVCTYTDETNTSRAQTIPFCQLAGTFLTSITNVTGTGPYEGATLEIRCKASTTIVFTTAGTVTGITYNIQGTVTQLN